MKYFKILTIVFALVMVSQLSYAQCCKSKGSSASTAKEVKFETTSVDENSVKNAVASINGVSDYSVCTKSKTVSVKFDESKTSSTKIKDALVVAGVQGVKETEACTPKKDCSSKCGTKTN